MKDEGMALKNEVGENGSLKRAYMSLLVGTQTDIIGAYKSLHVGMQMGSRKEDTCPIGCKRV
jgi:hypothetical protein